MRNEDMQSQLHKQQCVPPMYDKNLIMITRLIMKSDVLKIFHLVNDFFYEVDKTPDYFLDYFSLFPENLVGRD